MMGASCGYDDAKVGSGDFNGANKLEVMADVQLSGIIISNAIIYELFECQ